MDWIRHIQRLYRVAGTQADLSGIRIHYGNADHLCRAWGARAMTIGTDVYFRADSYAPHTRAGLWLLAHELAHVVQQRRGPVSVATVAGGWAVAHSGGAEEQEADAAADAVLAGKPFELGPAPLNGPGVRYHGRPVVQRFMAWEHVLLGNLGPQHIGWISRPAGRGAGAMTGLAAQCELLEELGRDPAAADTCGLRERYPAVQFLRLPAGLVVTGGELNVLPDYLSRPEDILAAPASFLLPLVQAVRAQSYRHIRHIMGRHRVSRRRWNTLGYPNARALPDIREALEIERLGKICGLPATERYLSVLGRNACHFAPFSWYRWQAFHLRARQLISQAREEAGERRQWLRSSAQVTAAYADHFLQDSFAAGHLVNKTLIMQWYVEWLTGSGQRLPGQELLSAMTCARQPYLHGPELYGPRLGTDGRMHPGETAGRPAAGDPQTVAEAATLAERLALSGVQGRTETERHQNYRCYLALLGSSVAQSAAGVVHDHFNRRSLVVANAADGPRYQVCGDRTMLGEGSGARAAAEAAQASRQAIADLLSTGTTGISSSRIFASMPSHVEVRGALVPLRQWHDTGLRDLCFRDLFGRTGTRLRRLLLSSTAPAFGVPSADCAELDNCLSCGG